MTRILYTLLVLGAAALLLPGCPPGGDDDRNPPGPNGDDDDASDDDDDDDDDDDSHDPEVECDDGADNDGDGQIDCADSDCADEFHCTWPDQMEHQARFEFYSDVGWMDDCEVRFESLLIETGQGGVCTQCDLSYGGQYQYAINTCEEFLELAGVDMPDEGMYGVVFVSPNEREIFTRDADMVWTSLGIAQKDPAVGHYLLQRHDDIESIGTLNTELTFTDM
jgi:hypothetical protein